MFASREIELRYNAAFDRYATAMANGTPDRIPIRFLFEEVAAKYAGYTTQQTACDYRLAFDATRSMAKDLPVDAAMLNAIWSNYGVGKGASWRYFGVPGVDIPMDSVCQFHEPSSEEELCMQADEYDELADDPTAFLLGKWLARYTSRLSPPGGPVTFGHNASLIAGAMAYQRYIGSFGEYADKLKYEAGVVSANAGMIKAPFDLLMDKLRGYQGAVVDAVTQPDKVRKACEALMPHIVKNALGGADPEKRAPITIWAHRGTVPFISPAMFDGILWPTLKPVFEEIISNGYRILFYGEGNWEAHYDRLMELPEGSIIYHLDRGDPLKLAGTLKRKFAVSGGLPYGLLTRGARRDVEAYLKTLFDTLAPDGGYILDCSALMMQDIDIGLVRAAIDYTLEHGVYSRSQSAARPAAPRPGGAAPMPQGRRAPGVCIPWEEESRGYRSLAGDVDLVRRSWEETDSWAYNYIWTTLLW
jgi:hypothetical protein